MSTTPSCAGTGDIAARPPRDLAAELHEALEDPDVDGVIGAIGGWTMLGVLEHVDLDLIGVAGKPIVGYSDWASLLNLIFTTTRLITFHGPMVLSEWGEANGPWSFTVEWFHALLDETNRWTELRLEEAPHWSDELLWWDDKDTRPRAPRAPGEQAVRAVRGGTAVGPLWGGSLVGLGLVAGTKFLNPAAGSVVVLEAEAIAPDEYWSRLEHLRLAGVFDEAVAVVLGKTSRPTATATGYDNYDEVARRVLPGDIPVVAGLDVGHTEPMLTLPIGGTLAVDADALDLRLHRPDRG